MAEEISRPIDISKLPRKVRMYIEKLERDGQFLRDAAALLTDPTAPIQVGGLAREYIHEAPPVGFGDRESVAFKLGGSKIIEAKIIKGELRLDCNGGYLYVMPNASNSIILKVGKWES